MYILYLHQKQLLSSRW